MRTKTSILALAALFLAAGAVHAKVGVAVSANHWEMDDKDLQKEASDTRNDGSLSPSITEVKKKKSLAGAFDLFVERPLREDLDWGVSFGYALSGKAKLDETYSNVTPYDTRVTLENRAESFPLCFYLRKTTASRRFSWVGGLGAEYIRAEAELTMRDLTDSLQGTFEDTAIAPFLRAGGDYHVTPSFSVGIGLKYLFSAELDDFRADTNGGGFATGNHRLVMVQDPPFGEFVSLSDPTVTQPTRPYKVDMGGLRIGLTFRYAFGS